MSISGYEYNIEGENYIDISSAADFLGISHNNFRNLMRGVEFGKAHNISFKRQGRKIFFKKENLKLLKEILSK